MEANKDCFAYVEKDNSCECLEHLYCKKEKVCKFYKTIEQLKGEQELADERNFELGINRRYIRDDK